MLKCIHCTIWHWNRLVGFRSVTCVSAGQFASIGFRALILIFLPGGRLEQRLEARTISYNSRGASCCSQTLWTSGGGLRCLPQWWYGVWWLSQAASGLRRCKGSVWGLGYPCAQKKLRWTCKSCWTFTFYLLMWLLFTVVVCVKAEFCMTFLYVFWV